MSMIAPPNQHQPFLPQQTPPRGSLLKEEWHHLSGMEPRRLGLLVLPSILLFVISPLLPMAAYALWLWASRSWAWRDRWASVTFWAKQGGVVVAFVLVLAALGATHVWIVPQLTEAAQAWWRTHLPGDLSLSPLDPHALPARTLLLLPLAPALTLLYEYLDPRTQVQPQRRLTAADLVEPTPTAAPPTSSPRPQARANPAPARSAPSTEQKRKSTRKPPQQMTIEGLLAPTPAQAAQPPPTPEVEKKTTPPEPPPAETHPPTFPDIDWNDVAE